MLLRLQAMLCGSKTNGKDYIGKVVINNIYDRNGTKFWSKAMVFAWLGIEEFNPGP